MRVLLADDQAWLRSALRLLLEHEPNIEVVGEASDARTLPGLTASLHPDLLLLDGELIGIKTNSARRRLITALRALHPDLYVIVLSNNHERNSSQLATGADAYVSKAEPPDRLLAALHRAGGVGWSHEHRQLAE
jgi:DNA-binding NarL/FixJ family response regulator